MFNRTWQHHYSRSSEKCNKAEAQDKDFKEASMNMFENLKRHINKYFKEIYKTQTNMNEMKKTF